MDYAVRVLPELQPLYRSSPQCGSIRTSGACFPHRSELTDLDAGDV